METIGTSFDNLQTAIAQALKDVKNTLEKVDSRLLRYEEKNRNVKYTNLKSQAESLHQQVT